MSISHIFFNFWRKLSMPLLVVTLTVCYFSLPDNAAVHHDENGRPDGFIDKQSFFYMTFGVIIIFNFLLNLLRAQVQKVDFAKVNPNSLWSQHQVSLKAIIDVWLNAFIAIVNTYIVFTLIALNRINRTNEQALDVNYNWLLIAGLVILMIFIFYLPLRLLFTNPKIEE